MNKNILVVASHPDDETIGCGGTLAKHIAEGDSVAIITLTNGVGSRIGRNKDQILREKYALKAMDALGVTWIGKGNFPDNRMDSVDILEICKFLEEHKKKFYPDLIYTHSHSDLNVDHRITFEAVLTAYRPQPEESYSEIRLFETPSSTDFSIDSLYGPFSPNLFVNISNFWEKKLEALNFYETEMRNYPHSRSYQKIKALAEYRGGSSGLELAEAFEIVRKINR